jgi:hypothetical protein
VITAKASGRGQQNRKENMIITQKMYNDYLDSMQDGDWKRIRTSIEERYPETKTWPEKMFRMYCSAVVRSGFRKEGLN